MDMELDCKGLQCPEPVARCRKLLETDHPDRLTVFVDNLAALENVSRFLTRNGFEITSSQLSPNEWEIDAHKKENLTVDTLSDDSSISKTLIFLTTETLGRGDDSLGTKLMETFLGSLPEMGESLWRIVLLNGAVKLAATPGVALEHLKRLERDGTGIFVCGTCLMHYGLLEKKQVGETTNMMDIITSLTLAQKIIRP